MKSGGLGKGVLVIMVEMAKNLSCALTVVLKNL
jgi:hypothetical protein